MLGALRCAPPAAAAVRFSPQLSPGEHGPAWGDAAARALYEEWESYVSSCQ